MSNDHNINCTCSWPWIYIVLYLFHCILFANFYAVFFKNGNKSLLWTLKLLAYILHAIIIIIISSCMQFFLQCFLIRTITMDSIQIWQHKFITCSKREGMVNRKNKLLPGTNWMSLKMKLKAPREWSRQRKEKSQ